MPCITTGYRRNKDRNKDTMGMVAGERRVY